MCSSMTQTKRLLRLALRTTLGLVATLVLAAGAVAAAIAYPAPMFPYQLTVGDLTLRSPEPIPDSAQAYLQSVDLSPAAEVPGYQGPVTVYLVPQGWRRNILFAAAPNAGGLTYAGLAPNHMFLSGADFDQGLLDYNGRLIAPPRDLMFYLRHESNHLALAGSLGFISFSLLPAWVREGVADIAALGPPDRARLDAALGDDPVTLDHMIAFGAYPRARLLVDWVMDTQGYDALIANSWTEAEAMAQFRAAFPRH